MALKLSTMSCPNGTRDVALDLTDALESSETITGTPTAVSSDTDTLNTSNVIANPAKITKESGEKISIGKGLQFQLATTVATVYLNLASFPATGSAGTWYYDSTTGLMYEWDATNTEYDLVTVPDSVTVNVWFEGTSGTAETYAIVIPINSPALTR